jgi:hypothetical protein
MAKVLVKARLAATSIASTTASIVVIVRGVPSPPSSHHKHAQASPCRRGRAQVPSLRAAMLRGAGGGGCGGWWRCRWRRGGLHGRCSDTYRERFLLVGAQPDSFLLPYKEGEQALEAGAMLCGDEEANEDEHGDGVVGKEEREGGVVEGQSVDADVAQRSSSGSHTMPAWDGVVEVAGGLTDGNDPQSRSRQRCSGWRGAPAAPPPRCHRRLMELLWLALHACLGFGDHHKNFSLILLPNPHKNDSKGLVTHFRSI